MKQKFLGHFTDLIHIYRFRLATGIKFQMHAEGLPTFDEPL